MLIEDQLQRTQAIVVCLAELEELDILGSKHVVRALRLLLQDVDLGGELSLELVQLVEKAGGRSCWSAARSCRAGSGGNAFLDGCFEHLQLRLEVSSIGLELRLCARQLVLQGVAEVGGVDLDELSEAGQLVKARRESSIRCCGLRGVDLAGNQVVQALFGCREVVVVRLEGEANLLAHMTDLDSQRLDEGIHADAPVEIGFSLRQERTHSISELALVHELPRRVVRRSSSSLDRCRWRRRIVEPRWAAALRLRRGHGGQGYV